MPGIYELVSWPIFGLFVGAIARFIMPGKQPMSWLLTMALGIAGSFVGGFLWFLLGREQLGAYGGTFTSIFGAFLLLFAYPKIQDAMNKTN